MGTIYISGGAQEYPAPPMRSTMSIRINYVQFRRGLIRVLVILSNASGSTAAVSGWKTVFIKGFLNYLYFPCILCKIL
jgi:hypothetical protein